MRGTGILKGKGKRMIKKIRVPILCLIFLLIGFFAGIYFGRVQLNKKLIVEEIEAARKMFEAQGDPKESIDVQLSLMEIQRRKDLSESRSKWVEVAVFAVLALNLLQSFLIYLQDKKIKRYPNA